MVLARVRRILSTRFSKRLIFLLGTILAIEHIHHHLSLRPVRPAARLDPILTSGLPLTSPRCPGTPGDISEPRANAAIVMLARNSDFLDAQQSIESFTRQFNKWYNYPIIYLNDEEFTPAFKESMTAISSPANVSFHTIPSSMWSYPPHIDIPRAQASMKYFESKGLPYAGKESYHHMCRFQSGPLFLHPALLPYDWYWRLEPGVSYTCQIPYDPFTAMQRLGKKYGYTLALWEVGSTSPSLFSTTSAFKATHDLPSSNLWKSMLSPSWAPLPLRPLLPALVPHRDAEASVWNMCHFWSNFEIASLKFFRSPEYQAFFEHLDASGGFYYERWGDAPIHSLAAAMFLKDSEVHHFADFGYSHPPFQQCPPRGQGCKCDCDVEEGKVPDFCLNRLRMGVEP